MPREAMKLRTTRESPRCSAQLFKTSIRKYKERAENLKGQGLRVGVGDGNPPCSFEAVGPCTTRESPPRSAQPLFGSIPTHGGRAKDLKGLPGLRVGTGVRDPPCCFEVLSPRTTRDSLPRSAKLFYRSIWKHEGRAEDLKGLLRLREMATLLARLRRWVLAQRVTAPRALHRLSKDYC